MSFLLLLFLHFTDTVEEFEDSIMQKKMKIPKMSIKNSGNSIENHFGEERLPLRHKKVGWVVSRLTPCWNTHRRHEYTPP